MQLWYHWPDRRCHCTHPSRRKATVRAVVRDAIKGRACRIAGAKWCWRQSRTERPHGWRRSPGSGRVFVLMPPNFDPLPEFPEAQAIGETLRAALVEANPARVVTSQRSSTGQRSLICLPNTRSLSGPSANADPITFCVRLVMENSRWDVAPARGPGGFRFPATARQAGANVATADIGKVAAGCFRTRWSGRRVIELEDHVVLHRMNCRHFWQAP